jgi:hypothetical protein
MVTTARRFSVRPLERRVGRRGLAGNTLISDLAPAVAAQQFLLRPEAILCLLVS